MKRTVVAALAAVGVMIPAAVGVTGPAMAVVPTVKAQGWQKVEVEHWRHTGQFDSWDFPSPAYDLHAWGYTSKVKGGKYIVCSRMSARTYSNRSWVDPTRHVIGTIAVPVVRTQCRTVKASARPWVHYEWHFWHHQKKRTTRIFHMWVQAKPKR